MKTPKEKAAIWYEKEWLPGYHSRRNKPYVNVPAPDQFTKKRIPDPSGKKRYIINEGPICPSDARYYKDYHYIPGPHELRPIELFKPAVYTGECIGEPIATGKERV